METYENNIESWLASNFVSNVCKENIRAWRSKASEKEQIEAFYQNLSFGTGGMRGLMGVGTNRMNVYTVARTTQGLADYILQIEKTNPSVAIAYDSRNMSRVFAETAASVLAANGIYVYLFTTLQPTPVLSYAVRELQTTSGIVITASHNPKKYNGYKVYWSDGAQIVSSHDAYITKFIGQIKDLDQIKKLDFEQAVTNQKVIMIQDTVLSDYYKKVQNLALGDIAANKKLSVLYTPLFGTGTEAVTTILKGREFEKFRLVEKQAEPNGDFPDLVYPNPEEEAAFAVALSEVMEEDALILATDPDADRLGVMVKHNEEWHKLTGNQIGALLFSFILEQNKKLPIDSYYVTTIVSSQLGHALAKEYGLQVIECLTGFKYIGAEIAKHEKMRQGQFIFGMEESHGYLAAPMVRDKDAPMAALFFSELTALLAVEKKTPIDKLNEIYAKYGYYEDMLTSCTIEGKKGVEVIEKLMSYFRNNIPVEVNARPVQQYKDYLQSKSYDVIREKETTIQLPKSNVLAFYLQDGTRITLRPSGTEPKIKFYFNFYSKSKEVVEELKTQYVTIWMQKINELIAFFQV